MWYIVSNISPSPGRQSLAEKCTSHNTPLEIPNMRPFFKNQDTSRQGNSTEDPVTALPMLLVTSLVPLESNSPLQRHSPEYHVRRRAHTPSTGIIVETRVIIRDQVIAGNHVQPGHKKRAPTGDPTVERGELTIHQGRPLHLEEEDCFLEERDVPSEGSVH
ncbi:hypothetical protein Bbelb_267020 [Branchiostoma belcheri]|nr:hypothetical protein Bbelb_267020 [Branchiostoma belcheri]